MQAAFLNVKFRHLETWNEQRRAFARCLILSLYSFYDSKGKTYIHPYLGKGFAWLALKVLADGTIDVLSNTRTGREQEKNPAGEFKQGRFGSPLPYIYWSYLGGGEDARKMALRIAQARKTRT